MPTGSTKKGLCQCLMSREVMQCVCVCECDGVYVCVISKQTEIWAVGDSFPHRHQIEEEVSIFL